MSKYRTKQRCIVKTGLLLPIVFLSLQAALSGPLVVVSKAVGPQQVTLTISGSQLPEMKSLTFECSYSMPVASIRNTIVSSQLPTTSLSVRLDTAANTISVTIRASTSVSAVDNAPLALFKIPVVANVNNTGVQIKRVIIVNKQGSTVEPAISDTTVSTLYNHPMRAVHIVGSTPGVAGLFSLDGKKIPASGHPHSNGSTMVQRRNGSSLVKVSVH